MVGILWKSSFLFYRFKFIRKSYNLTCKFSVKISKNCIPIIGGIPTNIEISIPLTDEALQKLPPAFSKGDWFRVRTVYWNIGVNHEATLAATMGDLSLEESVNISALSIMSSIVSTPTETPNDNLTNLFNDLKRTVEESPSRKNIAILTKVQALTRALNGSFIISCKSGKDRTSMAVTLEEGMVLKQNFGIAQQQVISHLLI